MSSPAPVLVMTVMYLGVVLKFGPQYMEKRKPYNLKPFLIVYNLFQMCACYWAAVRVRFHWLLIILKLLQKGSFHTHSLPNLDSHSVIHGNVYQMHFKLMTIGAKKCKSECSFSSYAASKFLRHFVLCCGKNKIKSRFYTFIITCPYTGSYGFQ